VPSTEGPSSSLVIRKAIVPRCRGWARTNSSVAVIMAARPALHVGGAATVQHPVAHGRDEGVGPPLFKRPCGYDVGVSGEADDGIGECAGTIVGPGSCLPPTRSRRVAQKFSTLP
jgi:hypothetical protein